MARDALAEIAEYVRLQTSLLNALSRLAPAGWPSAFGDIKGTGEVELGSESWHYQRHGGGILFHERRTGRQVDVHRHIDRPDLFDTWRLRTYLGSLGRSGVKLVEHAIGKRGLALDQAIEEMLGIWLSAEQITKDSGSYRLSGRQSTSARKI